jgi:hypothetical protein
LHNLLFRVKDVNVARKTIVIKSGKGDKDRETVPPALIVPALEDHLAKVKALYEKDRESNQPGVALPGTLERKYPNAGKEWAWFWVFPSYKLSADPPLGCDTQAPCSRNYTSKALEKGGFQVQDF